MEAEARSMSTYVYGFTHSLHPLPLEGMVGVGASAPPLRVVREGDLNAVVSDAPPDLRPKRRDLTTHETVLERLCAAGTVLPMRFGMVAPDDGAVRAELQSGARRYAELLSRIEGHVELNVKGVHREDALLRDLLLGNHELLERNQALRAVDGGSHQDKVAFGERVATVMEDRRSRDAERAMAQLRPHASQMRLGPPVDGCFVNVSFLVASRALGEFQAAVLRLREALIGYANVEVYGPLPPYSFVSDNDGKG
jgi:hypothetical protein